MTRQAVVLLSGGLDSATVAAAAIRDGFEVHALSIQYGHRQSPELESARNIAQSLGIRDHRVVTVDLGTIGGSALTDRSVAVPKSEAAAEVGADIPITYVPARNTIMLSIALGLAEVCGAYDIFFGANVLDYSGYPDCRPAFRAAFEALANVATKAVDDPTVDYRVRAPLMDMTKADIIRLGVSLGVDYAITHSCYDPDADGLACGRCDSCHLRRKGFEEAQVPDPTRYGRNVAIGVDPS